MVDISRIINQGNKLFNSTERSNVESLWKDISEFILNNQHNNFSQPNEGVRDRNISSPGRKTTNRVFDSTAPLACQNLSSAFQGTITNPATTWSTLKYQEEFLNEDDEAVRWLDRVNHIIHNEFNESNFNTEITKGYKSFVALANMVLFHEEDDKGRFVFNAVPVNKVAWSEDQYGIVDTIYRKFTLTAKQAADKFKSVHSDILLAAIEEPEKEFQFLHYIGKRDPKKVKLNKMGLASGKKRPIASIYIDMQHMDLVEETGYYEMPVYVARWDLNAGELIGRGLGHLALPDVRTLNKLVEKGLKAIDYKVQPVMFVNRRDVVGGLDKLDMNPGSVNVVNDIRGITDFVPRSDIQVLQFSTENLMNNIKSIFYLDKLLLPPRTETGEMTAYEVAQRTEQMQRVLGPVLSRLNTELLSPLIIRSFKMLLRSGRLPEVPDILKEYGISIDITYVNQLARSQQIQDVNTIQQWIQGLAMIAQMKPEVMDLINADGIGVHTARVLGVPEQAILGDREVRSIREQRAQAQQQAAQAEQMVKGADVMSKLGGLPQGEEV